MVKKVFCGVFFVFILACLCNRSMLAADVIQRDIETPTTEQDASFGQSVKNALGWLCIPLGIAGIVLWIYLKPSYDKIEISVDGAVLYKGNNFDKAKRAVRKHFGKRGINPQVFGRSDPCN